MQLLYFPVLFLLLDLTVGENAKLGPAPILTADKNTTDISEDVKLTCTNTELKHTDVKYEWFLSGNREQDLGTSSVSTLQFKHIMKEYGHVSCRVTDMDGYPITLQSHYVLIHFTGPRATLTADKTTTHVSGEIKLTCTYTSPEDAGDKYVWLLDGNREKELGTSSVSTLQYKPPMENMVDVSCLVTDMDGNPITLKADSVIIHFTGPKPTVTADKNTTDVSGEVELTCTYNGKKDVGVKYKWFLGNSSRKELGTSSVSTLQYKPGMEKTVHVSCLVTDMDGNPITLVADPAIIHFTEPKPSSAVSIGSGVILPLLLLVTSSVSVW